MPADMTDFSDFYIRHYRQVYRLCYFFMQNRYDAEDCTEDTFLRVLEGKYTFQSEEHEEAWLSVTASNLCRDRLRYAARRNTVPLEGLEETLEAPGEVWDDTLTAVMKLPPRYKEVIFMYYYQGYPTEKIAKLLHRPASTVRNQLMEARNLLKSVLKES